MTGAQEQALERLKKRHAGLVVHGERDDYEGDVIVSYERKASFGSRTVDARVTPEGRVIELP